MVKGGVNDMTKLGWLQNSNTWSIIAGLGDDAYNFYYRAMHDNQMDLYDADDYAWLNTLIGYDIGIDNAREIMAWLSANDQAVLEFGAEHLPTLRNICDELNLKVDFNNAVKETPKAIRYEW